MGDDGGNYGPVFSGIEPGETGRRVGLFVLSFLANAVFVFARGNFSSPSTWENGDIARNLIAGEGFSYSYFGNPEQLTSVMAPFYPYFLAGVYAVFGVTPTAHLFVQLLQAGVQAGSVVVLYLLGKRLFDARVGLVAAVGFALFPDYVYATSVVHQLTFATFAVLGLVALVLRFRADPSSRGGVVVGAALGVSALVLPSVLFYAPVMATWLLWELSRRRGPADAVKLVGVLTLAAMLVVAPWTVRNYLVHDQFVLVKMTGFNFWRANTPPAIHTGIPKSRYEDVPAAVRSMREAEGNALLGSRAVEYVSTHPLVFAGAVVRRAIEFWWFPPGQGESLQHVLRRLAYVPVLVTGAAGVALSRNRWRRLLPIYLVFVAFTVGYALFFVLARYRTPTTQPFLVLFSGYAVWRAVERFAPGSVARRIDAVAGRH